MTQEELFKRYSYDVDKDYIGGGGFGSVYKAYDNVLHRDVAIKVSEVKKAPNGKTFSLRDEIEALSGLPEHPNIANYEKDKLFSFKTPQGNFDYAVMQFYPDGNLTQAIKEGLTNEQKEEIATQLLEGIAFLHQHKVVHRDLKPGNILVAKHGGKVIPLITDFGLSKAADAGDGSMFSNSFGGGTPRYSSPEQLQGKPLRFNTDLWSYGAIVYELFTSEQLFGPGSGAANSAQADLEIYNKIVRGDVEKLAKMPERWRKVAERCMVVDPEKRVKTAEELLFLLKGYEETTLVAQVSEPKALPRQPQTQPIAEEKTQLTPKSTPKLVDPKPVGRKTPEPPKDEKPQKPKKMKGLWIGLAAVAVIALVLVLLLRPTIGTPVPVASVSTTNANLGVFSISSSQRVHFAEGNLMYQPSTHGWYFAKNPWDYIGKANKNISPNYSGWIDLFGWGTGDDPTKRSTDDSDYSNFSDWGSTVGGGWRTLTKDEWVYVFDKRSTASGIRYAMAKVNGVNGVILLPDNWSKTTHSLNNTNSVARFGSNRISSSTWNNTFAPAGAVFLPAAGSRYGTSVYGVGSYGYYWSASPGDSYDAYSVYFDDGYLNADNWNYRSYGQGVRLSRPAEN